MTALDHVGGDFVGIAAVGHAADDGVLVSMLRQLRKLLADPDALHLRLNRFCVRTTVVVTGFGFRIEGVKVRRAAPHPDLDA